ncbi:MAG: ATP-binding protein [archaeon]|nr:ATP-binding protein [archaeon]
MDSQKNTTKETKTPPQEISRTCVRHGEYKAKYSTTIFGSGKPIYAGCPECIVEQKEEDRKHLESERLRKNKLRIDNSKIPLRFMKNNIEDFKTSCKEAADIKEKIKGYIEKFMTLKKYGTSLIFSGNPGTGKTHLACCIGMELINQGESVEYTSTYDIISKIKATYGKRSEETEREIVTHYKNINFLILDEIGVQFDSKREGIILFQILNGRYENYKPTILITNLNNTDLLKTLGERIVDRFYENKGGVFSFEWDSYRRK